MRRKRPDQLYARLRRVAVLEPMLFVRLLLGAVMHALGHAAVAAAAGSCARALAGGGAPLPGGRDARWMVFFQSNDARVIAFVGLGAVVVKVGAAILAAQSEAVIAKQVGDRLRVDLLDGWLRHHRLRSVRHRDQGGVPVAQDGRAHPATAAAQATLHVMDVEQGVVRGVIGRARAVAELLPLCALLLALNPKLALAAAVSALPFAIVTGRARKRLRREIAEGHDEVDALATAADEAVRHADLWTVFGAEARVRASIGKLGKTLRVRASRVAVLTAATSGANEVLAALALVLTAVAAKAGWLGLSDGGLLPFMVAFFLAYKPLRALSEARIAVARAHIMLDKMRPLLDKGDTNEDEDDDLHEDRAERDWGIGTLVVRDLILRGSSAPVSFEVKPGELVVIVGPTGAGKTTLLRTLLGLEGAEGGTIVYGGMELSSAAVGPRTRPFSFVPQDAPIVADTLSENVALGGALDARGLLLALGAEPLSLALGEQRLGPGGRALSGGERQLVCMARAFASTSPIVMLDEPTSGLDAMAERAVLGFLMQEKARRPILMVSHKPAPIAAADRIVTLK